MFGWDLTIAVQTNHDPQTLPGYPLLIAGIGFNIPGTALIHTARHIFESVTERGYPAGRAIGDRGYFASAAVEDFQMPLRMLGYTVVTDDLDLQLGLKDGYAGAIQVRKLEIRRKRKNRKKRVAAWDDFQKPPAKT